MGTTKFERQPKGVDAIQWTGDNLDAVKQFLGRFYHLEDVGLRPFTGQYYDTPDVPQIGFRAWDDEYEEVAAPGEWIVIETPPGEVDDDEVDHFGYGRVMGAGAFEAEYRPAGPAPAVAGFCPVGCGQTLHLAAGGVITCFSATCPRPTAAAELLADSETEHLVEISTGTFSIRHPLRERLDDAILSCRLGAHIVAVPPETGRYRISGRPGDDTTGLQWLWDYERLPPLTDPLVTEPMF